MSSVVMSSDDESFVILGSTPTPSMLDQLDCSPSATASAAAAATPSASIRQSSIRLNSAAAAASAAGSPATSLTNAAMQLHSQNDAQPSSAARVRQWQSGRSEFEYLDVNDFDPWAGRSLATGPPTQSESASQHGDGGESSVSFERLSISSKLLLPTPVLAAGLSMDASQRNLANGAGGDGGGCTVADGIGDGIGATGIDANGVSFRIADEVTSGMLRQSDGADSEMLRQSVAEQFPSLMEAAEVRKLGSFIYDQQEMKENLEKANQAMLLHFDQLNVWQENMLRYKNDKQRQALKYQQEIAMLKFEVQSLQKELTLQGEHSRMQRKIAEDENIDLVQKVSNQNSMLLNMSGQIAQLEQNLHSFEVINPGGPASAVSAASAAQAASDQTKTIDELNQQISELSKELSAVHLSEHNSWSEQITERDEQIRQLKEELLASQSEVTRKLAEMGVEKDHHENLIKMLSAKLEDELHDKNARTKELRDARSQMSAVVAENLETQDMKQIYVDQINCLETNLVAAEELLKKANADIADLNAHRAGSAQQLADKAKEIDALQARVSLLEAQLEVYREDFETERKARQSIASEREQILSNLKLMQRRNDELMQQRIIKPSSATPSAPSTSTAAPSTSASSPSTSRASAPRQMVQYVCPVCTREFPHLKTLETHIEGCLN